MMSMTIVRPGGGGRSRLDGLTRWASWHGKRESGVFRGRSPQTIQVRM